MSSKVLSAFELENELTKIRNATPGVKTVLCHGVFDLVHPGHLEHLRQAKKWGDILVLSITADKFVNKGPNRPYFSKDQRAMFLAAFEMISFVYISESDSALAAVEIVKPDFYVKGPDYRVLQDDITGKIRVEKETTEKFGGKLVFTDGFTSSSTNLINEALMPQNSELRLWVKEFKRTFSVAKVNYWIDKLSSVDVAVLGETIIDVYSDCTPLAKSSKDPILAFHHSETRTFMGGVLAIADLCSSWSRSTVVYSTCGKDFQKHLAEITREFKFEQHLLELVDSPTIVKHRFVDINSGNKVFEYYDYNPDVLDSNLQLQIARNLDSRLKSKSLLILADYGHGFFGKELIQELCSSKAFLSVNTQANAGNRGFNTFSKYPRIDFLSLNGGELELEMRRKNLDYQSIVPDIMKIKKCKYVVVTLGANGLLTFDASGKSSHTPAMASKVVDKVGAGDSVLAVAAMLAFLEAPKEIIGLLSSVVAAFEVSQLGHKETLSLVNMKKFVNGLLG